jgi:hypothetical protein
MPFPAWELVRLYDRQIPRDWYERWSERAGPRLIEGRLIAWKTDRIWENLGKDCEDGIDAPHPPYACNSGMGWREGYRAEMESAGVTCPTCAARMRQASSCPNPPRPCGRTGTS